MARSHHKYWKELNLLMLNNGFKLARESKHLVWQNNDVNVSISTSRTPKGVMAIKQVKRDIRRAIGSVK
mgnify:FL=1